MRPDLLFIVAIMAQKATSFAFLHDTLIHPLCRGRVLSMASNEDLTNALNFVIDHAFASPVSDLAQTGPMTIEEVFAGSLASNLRVEEVNGGNTNFNFHVWDETRSPAKGVFVKHAKPFAKGFGESASMSVDRLR